MNDLPEGRVVVTGDPRDDVLQVGPPTSTAALDRDALARTQLNELLLGTLPETDRVVLYAPTWRDGDADPAVPTADEWAAIADWLAATATTLVIRTHPLGRGDYAAGPAASDRVRMLGADLANDVTPLLPAFDALVTDYSSIAFDFSVLGRPIVFLASDVSTYTASRGLYESYRGFSGGHAVATWAHAVERLDERLASGDAADRGSHERWLRDEHFDHLDGRATERVLAEVLARTGYDVPELDLGQDVPRVRVTGLDLRAAADDAAEAGATAWVRLDSEVTAARLVGPRATVVGEPDASDGGWSFPLEIARWGAEPLPLPSATYRLVLDLPDGSRTSRIDVDTEPSSGGAGIDIASAAGERVAHRFSPAAGGIELVAASPVPAGAEQRRRELRYRTSAATAEDAVLFESFYGRSASDNPLGIDRALAELRPDVTRYWSVSDGSIAVPAGAIPVLEGSDEWWRVRASARVLVVNDWMRKRWRKRPHQHVLQTWHGTMLKRLALDRPRVGWRTKLAVRRERGRWDALLAQNAYAGDIFRSAYAMDSRPIWETGYPRNDVLHAPETGARIRSLLGIAAEARVVLYAPTWRDDRLEMVDDVDLARLAADLGENHVLLVRGHSRTLQHGQDLTAPGLVDVTTYPDITELLAASDVLVTDYSSVMFDWTVTGRPIVFFTPDLAHYGEDLRGFYFDLLAEAPGPIVREPGALGAAILHAGTDAGAAEHAAGLAVWRSKFTPHDDGGAGARVVEKMLAEGWL